MFKEVVEFIKNEFPGEDFIPLHEPVFEGNEKKYVLDTIDSTFVSSVGKYVDRFEEMIKEYTGSAYAIATVNGTAALHMSLLLAGVQRGDYVLTQPLSFIATCNAISYLSAEPYFIDVSAATLGLSYEALKEFFEQKTYVKNGECFLKSDDRRISACVPMHTFGFPAEIDLIADLCERNGVVLVEDAAESLGSTYKGRQTGSFGKIGAFSFNGNKTITSGGGGVIVTDDEQLGKLGKHLTTQAKVPHKWDFVHDHIGYNYRMPNLNAALACAQLEQLEGFIANKRDLAGKYADFFASTPYSFVKEPADSRANYWLNAVLFADTAERNNFLEYANGQGVMTRPCWTLMDELTMFKHCRKEALDNAKQIAQVLVNLPSSVRKNKGQ